MWFQKQGASVIIGKSTIANHKCVKMAYLNIGLQSTFAAPDQSHTIHRWRVAVGTVERTMLQMCHLQCTYIARQVFIAQHLYRVTQCIGVEL